jgi:hypothetical protein
MDFWLSEVRKFFSFIRWEYYLSPNGLADFAEEAKNDLKKFEESPDIFLV